MSRTLRDRSTCVVTRGGKLLLVADSKSIFMLPGGGVDPGESIKAAAVRELLEETGLIATRTEFLYVFESATNRHHIFAVEAEGEIDAGKIEVGGEVHGYLWWDMESDLCVYAHVTSVRNWLQGARPKGNATT